MFVKMLAFLCLLPTASAFAAGATKDPAKFDVIVAPYFAPQHGSYAADTIDQGTVDLLQFGARLGFKLGPVLIGGEFGGAYLMANSTQSDVTTANQQRYSSNGRGSSLHIGVDLGLLTDRWALIATYFPSMNYDASSNTTGTNVTAKYTGVGYSAEIDYRVQNRLYIGLFASSRDFQKITSGALKDDPLDPTWKSMTYGLTICYLVTFGDFAKIPDAFKAL